MTSSKWSSPRGRTTIGCSNPTSPIEVTSSAIASSSKTWRGCTAFGRIEEGTSSAK